MIFIGVILGGYKIKRKIISISIVLLLLVIIPSTSIAAEIPTPYEGNILLKGFVKVSEIENNTVHAFAIRLTYLMLSKDERAFGWISLNDVVFPDGYFMIPFGELTYVLGISTGILWI